MAVSLSKRKDTGFIKAILQGLHAAIGLPFEGAEPLHELHLGRSSEHGYDLQLMLAYVAFLSPCAVTAGPVCEGIVDLVDSIWCGSPDDQRRLAVHQRQGHRGI